MPSYRVGTDQYLKRFGLYRCPIPFESHTCRHENIVCETWKVTKDITHRLQVAVFSMYTREDFQRGSMGSL